MTERTEARKRDKLWQRPWRFILCQYFKLVRIEAPPRTVALGLAIGVFVGCLPIVPFQFVTALALSFLLRGSKVAALIGTLISNPLNFVPFYMTVFWIGRAITGLEVSPPSPSILNPENFDLSGLLDGSRDLLLVMLSGGFVLAAPSSIVSYFLGLKAVTGYRRRRAARMLKRYGLTIEELKARQT
ncbi:DUF2062 domain-containing protein, partial [Deltaproteobacteria bacterium OttesenSCG-928-K17]|nr:DUF2062 domain-containing protein [Deltaproteobacteria bacterium OttesenSCG-928-K17]